MSQYRENPDEPIRHDWMEGGKPATIDVGEDWRLLAQGEGLKVGDGFLHPETGLWIDFDCRPDIFRGDKEIAHTWLWRRRVEPDLASAETDELNRSREAYGDLIDERAGLMAQVGKLELERDALKAALRAILATAPRLTPEQDFHMALWDAENLLEPDQT